MVDDKSLLKERDPLPEHFDSLEEAGEFWDTHSSADYEDLTEDVEFEINLSKREVHYYAIAKEREFNNVPKQHGVKTLG